MRRVVKDLLTKVGTDTYGPSASNPVYEATHKQTGVVYRITRHQWVMPTTSWGWKADPVRRPDGNEITTAERRSSKGRKTLYGDNLEDLLCKLGHSEAIYAE